MAYLDVISLADAKLYLRVDDTLTEDDDQITLMIKTALRHIEKVTNVMVYDRDKTFRFIDGSVRVYDYPINSVIKPSKMVYATGTAQCTSVIATDTITVNGLLYTAVSGDPADDTQFSIGTDTACATSLARAVNGDSRAGTLGDVSATSTGDTVTFTSDRDGYDGNAVTLSQTGGTITLSGATFSGGLDGDLDSYEESTLYTEYCYGSSNSDLILNVGYTDPTDVPSDLKQVAYEIINLLYYEKQTGRGMDQLSTLAREVLETNKRFII